MLQELKMHLTCKTEKLNSVLDEPLMIFVLMQSFMLLYEKSTTKNFVYIDKTLLNISVLTVNIQVGTIEDNAFKNHKI